MLNRPHLVISREGLICDRFIASAYLSYFTVSEVLNWPHSAVLEMLVSRYQVFMLGHVELGGPNNTGNDD